MLKAIDSIRFDFTAQHELIRGSERTLAFHVVDSEGASIASFTGWSFAFYIVRDLYAHAGVDELNAGANTVVGDENIDRAAPYIHVDMLEDTWPSTPGMWFYELWRTDSPNRRPIAYGDFPVIH